ncbi:dihydrolipoamide acetyltransferase family protein [Nocardioides sp. CN2-186]|uniref:dihydrolipoamide acetyltransferase family protein n=1 Tax=Nocardioides tweenelious TaxID=3156607 RepID=UPI0032B53AF8
MAEFKLPDVGEGLTEAEIVVWKVKVGDVVAINDIIVDIETAKSIVELPSPYAGTVTALMVAEGEMVPVGTPIIAIGDPSAAEPVEPVETPEIDLSNPAASGGGEGESLVGRNKADRGPIRRARKVSSGAVAAHMQAQAAFETGAAPMVEADEEPVPSVTPAEAAPVAVRTLAKPPVRKLAKDLGVDLSTLTPTGANGTVCRADVEAAAGSEAAGVSRQAPKGPSSTTGERETREPIKGVRKMMGQAMVQSAFTLPHVTEWVTVDMTGTMELVDRLKARRELRDVKVSPLLVLSRAVILAMRRTPEINSWWDDAAQEVVFKSYVNLGIAAATPRGLVVPNIKDAQDLSLVELAGALAELTSVAREGRTQPAEMSGGTFTITNVGPFGVDGGTPIINPGESAILCFGAVKKQPWVVDDEIVVRQVCTLSLSFDHRHIDGEKGSRFLSDVAGILEDPGTALLY